MYKIYAFTVSDPFKKTIFDIWSLARRAVMEENEFDLNSGGDGFVGYILVMVKAEPTGSTTTVYHFEVWKL